MAETFIILGATGHVGSVVTRLLLEENRQVVAVTSNPHHADGLRRSGARAVTLDVRDTPALHDVLQHGDRLFLLNPPAAPTTDTDREERATAASIIAALKGSGIRKIVAQSTYGARPGTRLGDLAVLYELEQALQALAIPTLVMRVAYLMSNYDHALPMARQEGVLPSMFPADFLLPMVAPQDVGAAAAAFLREPEAVGGVRHVEGPKRFSPADVASALSEVIGRTVVVESTPPERFVDTFRAFGFSEGAALSYAGMTRATLEQPDFPTEFVRGTTDLRRYFADGIAQSD